MAERDDTSPGAAARVVTMSSPRDRALARFDFDTLGDDLEPFRLGDNGRLRRAALAVPDGDHSTAS